MTGPRVAIMLVLLCMLATAGYFWYVSWTAPGPPAPSSHRAELDKYAQALQQTEQDLGRTRNAMRN